MIYKYYKDTFYANISKSPEGPLMVQSSYIRKVERPKHSQYLPAIESVSKDKIISKYHVKTTKLIAISNF